MTSISIAGVIVYLIAIPVAFQAIRQARTPQGAVGWAVLILTMPWFGIPGYLLFGYTRIKSFTQLRRTAAQRVSTGAQAALAPDPEKLARLAAFDAISDHPVTRGGGMTLLPEAEEAFDAMLAAIDAAERYVLVQFYTIRDDGIGGRLADALVRAKGRGVRVWVMVDALGSVTLSRRWWNQLSEAGIALASHKGPSRTVGRFGLNFRNHRKGVVVDGTLGFTGGFNVGDEYLTDWRDTHARLAGPLVAQLQSLFVQDWLAITGEDIEDGLFWSPPPDPADMHGLLIGTGPTDPHESGILYFCALAQAARRRLWIATPYFVPDHSEIAALKLAALQGIEVRILVPEVPDRWIPWAAAFDHFDDLRAAGCEIWRYQPHFMHQKVALVDDDLVSVGSINFDIRSSLLNFEATAIVADAGAARAVEDMLAADFARSTRLETNLADQPLWLRIAAPLARLMSPIL